MYPDVPRFCAPTPSCAFNSEWALVPSAAPPAGPTQHVAPTSSDSDASDQQLAVQQRLVKLMEATGCSMIQNNGQRRLGPPAEWNGPLPGRGCEVFIGRIPRCIFEDRLYPIFSKVGRLYELRLMMDFSGTNRGFGFALYATSAEADKAVEVLDGHEVLPGKFLGVVKSVDNRRLFVGGLPKDKSRSQVWHELNKLVTGITDVILYSSVGDKSKSRGFAFAEFESHRSAAIARRRLIPGSTVLWDQVIAVDWAEPEPEVPAKIMATVKVLYMRNLMLSTSEDKVRQFLHGIVPSSVIEKVKRIKDFAFLHFSERHYAEKVLHSADGQEIDGSVVTVVWAKPAQHLQKSTVSDLDPDNDDAKMNNKMALFRGAGGLRKVSSVYSKVAPSMRCHIPPLQSESVPRYEVAVNGQSPTGFFMSNWQALLMFCRQLNLEAPQFEILETSHPDRRRLARFARCCGEVVVPCSVPSCRFQWKLDELVVFKISLPGIAEPNNMVTGAICDTPEVAQENAAALALRILYTAFYQPPNLYTIPTGAPVGISPQQIMYPPFM